jgi:hypothetical protein
LATIGIKKDRSEEFGVVGGLFKPFSSTSFSCFNSKITCLGGSSYGSNSAND